MEGLFSKAVWSFEQHAWNQVTGGDAAETGSGPGSYNIKESVWHVNCCNPQLNGGGGWGIFNALFGWQNSATYGSVLSYNLYWVAVMIGFFCMRYYEKKGHWPFVRPKAKAVDAESGGKSSDDEGVVDEKTAKDQGVATTSTTREIPA